MNIPELRQQFISQFHIETPATVVQAPGRVNLIGEHTDYNDGFVCPMAIDRSTVIVCTPRKDSLVRMYSTIAKQVTEFAIDREIPKKDVPGWSLYARGVAEALRLKGLLKHGMDALVASDVPIGGGLSSSASFEVATGLALLTLNHTTMNMVDLALACQWAEHNYPGMPCGIMDQFISSMGQKGFAMLLDCRDRTTAQVPLNDPNLRIVIANSNVKHELVQGEYTNRRHQCEAAVRHLTKRYPQITSLRDVTMNMLEDARMGMDPMAYIRAKHVISEITRTTEFAAAMAKHDYVAAGKLMYASHLSLKNDYAVSCEQLDTLVEIASTVPGVYGARMTGGGFGGCIVAMTKADAVASLTKKIEAEYPRKHGKNATIFATVASQGAHIVTE